MTCLSRLDHNRAVSQIAKQTKSKLEEIKDVFILGNHSLTQYPCIEHISVNDKNISTLVEKKWLEEDFVKKVQKRGGEILEARGGSSVFSAASAVIDHLKDWYLGSKAVVSMGIKSNGSYDIPEGLWSSFPVRCTGNFKYEIITEYKLSEFGTEKIKQTVG